MVFLDLWRGVTPLCCLNEREKRGCHGSHISAKQITPKENAHAENAHINSQELVFIPVNNTFAAKVMRAHDSLQSGDNAPPLMLPWGMDNIFNNP